MLLSFIQNAFFGQLKTGEFQWHASILYQKWELARYIWRFCSILWTKKTLSEFASIGMNSGLKSRLDMKENGKCITFSLSTSTWQHCFVDIEGNSGIVCLGMLCHRAHYFSKAGLYSKSKCILKFFRIKKNTCSFYYNKIKSSRCQMYGRKDLVKITTLKNFSGILRTIKKCLGTPLTK